MKEKNAENQNKIKYMPVASLRNLIKELTEIIIVII